MTTLAYMRGYETKRIPFGFSWTTLIFGIWPSVFRGHWQFVLISISCMCAGWFWSVLIFQGGDAGLFVVGVRVFLAAIRNHTLHNHVVAQGWRIGRRAPVVPINIASND